MIHVVFVSLAADITIIYVFSASLCAEFVICVLSVGLAVDFVVIYVVSASLAAE